MPFDSVSFRGTSNYPDARYFLSSYLSNPGELNGVLIGNSLNGINLTDTYYFDTPYSQIDVSNL